MHKQARIFHIHQQLKSRRTPITTASLAELYECSEKTIKRDLDILINQHLAPLEQIPSQGWRYQPDKQGKFELPGLWMSEQELITLIMLLAQLDTLGNGLLSTQIQSTRALLQQIFTERGLNQEQIKVQLKILPIAYKTLPSKTLYLVAEALFKGQQLHIHYTDFKQQHSQRNISPQTLVYYRDNWYIDAWCHLRKQLRTFSIARISQLHIQADPIIKLSTVALKSYFSASYGIFSGTAEHTASLKFAPQIAHEIAMQRWHQNQYGRWEKQCYLLDIPYGNSEELMMDIMRYLPHVEILKPKELKNAIKQRLIESLKKF